MSDSNVKALEILRMYKRLNEKKQFGLSDEEQSTLTEIEKKLAQLVNPSESKNATNQRRALRVATNLEVNLNTMYALKKAYIKNVSGGGLYIETASSATMGQKLEIELTLPGEESSFKVSTEVAWVNPRAVGDLGPGIGVRFLNLDDKKRTKIQRLVESALEKELTTKKPEKK
jgi:uncharacterized protein (TIGR02266 family)